VERNFHGRVYDSLALKRTSYQPNVGLVEWVERDAFNDNKETFNRFCDGLSIEEEGVLNGSTFKKK
jgi:hypothetical protein